ncbi:hypothetical protein J4220_03225 [Candidatus Micrarchaeota archaeon]|nr:hypothetical protein [Candidatus Micrarchaeota archaeon]
MKVLVDTNVLFAFLDEKWDFVNIIKDAYMEVDFFVLQQSLDEIKANSTLADDLVFDWAKANRGVVSTRDFNLKKRLKKAGVQVISLKNNKLVL